MKSDAAVRVTGAYNLTTTQVTAGAVATLVAANATRRSVLIRNNGTGTDEVAVGEATVTTVHGTRLKAGESCPFTFTGIIQVLAITGTPIVTAAEEWE